MRACLPKTYYRRSISKRGNINWAPKQIKNADLKVLFGRLNKLFGLLINFFGAKLSDWSSFDYDI